MLQPAQHHFLSEDFEAHRDLENRINDWGIFLRMETYSSGGIDAFSRIMTDGIIIKMNVIAMSWGNGTSSWSDSCSICCKNDFFRNGMIPGDYCCCCSDGCSCDSAKSPSDPMNWSGLAKGWTHQKQVETG